MKTIALDIATATGVHWSDGREHFITTWQLRGTQGAKIKRGEQMIAVEQKMCINETIRVVVYGKAEPAGSKKAFALRRRDGSLVTRPNGAPIINITDDNSKSRGFKQDVAKAARAVYNGPLLDGPLDVLIVFYRPRLKAHLRKDGSVKDSALDAKPVSKPDVLKLARGVEDALTGVVWRDDAQIVDERIRKMYGEPARVEIEIRKA